MAELTATEQLHYVFLQNYIPYIIVSESTGCWFRSRNNTKIRSRVQKIRYQTAVLSAVLFLDYKYPNNEKLIICHKCDTPACFNPDHLFVGTQQDNLYDLKLKRIRKLTIEEKIQVSEGKLKLESEIDIFSLTDFEDEVSEEELNKI